MMITSFGCSSRTDPPDDPELARTEHVGAAAEALTCVTFRRGGLGGASDATISVDPTDPSKAGTNAGLAILLQAGAVSTATAVSLLRFDLSPIPSAANVASATLSLRKYTSPGQGSLVISRALAPWAESSVTWSSFGGAISPNAEATVAMSSIPNSTTFNVDLTALVQSWVGGAAPNDGIVFSAAGGGRISVASSDASVSAIRPQLSVCYSLQSSCNDGLQNGTETGVDCGGACAPCCVPSAEVCNGLDDDCNGIVDDNNPGGGQACATGLAGACASGVSACQGGSIVCGQTVVPAAETCNGVDDNCDGLVDEGNPEGGAACATGQLGACSAGSVACAAGLLLCMPSVAPVPESCDGVDEDCDGTVDNGDPGGGLPCATGLFGACGAGATSCVGGVISCAQTIVPAAETCNGVDDDCNGGVDELGTVSCGVGACAATVTACVGGAPSTCVPGAPSAEICDGLFDEDCDGVVDDGCACVNGAVQSCYGGAPGTLGVGACSAGTQTCVGGAWGACSGEVLPAAETCNGKDDDCDGAIDQGNPGGGGACSTGGLGACGMGALLCSGGALACQALAAPSSEVCNGTDDDCDGATDEGVTSTFYLDGDGDGFGSVATSVQTCAAPPGYVADASDCDDGNGATFPGALEICNGVDDNCSGAVDEGVTLTFYADLDGDGYGTSASTTQACAPPAGYVASGGDCNDASAAVSPAGIEVCNAQDDDCDGAVDEGVTLTFYADADGDSFGNPAITAVGCAAPAGFVSNGADCNDASAAQKPGAVEVCNGTDDNCNGVIDEGVKTTYYQDADGDGFGNAAAPAQACSQPAGYVSNASDCNDTKFSVKPGGVEVCNSIDDNCNGQIDELVTLTYYADADGDGYGTNVTTQACSVPAGYAAVNGDCNDASPSVNPGAAESCNLADDNCNGQVDEGDPGGGSNCATGLPGACSTGTLHCKVGALSCVQDTSQVWYFDGDDDGYGAASPKVTQCTQPVGYAPVAGDCDDTDEEVNPGAAEVCDGVDDNCDGSVDNGVANPPVWYFDGDDDGYGAASPTATQCAQPSGYVPSGGDCNDANAAVSPGGAESCNGADDNCNGVVDEGNPDSGASCSTGLLGVCAPGATACFGGSLICVQTGASGPEVCNSKDDNCDGAVDEGGVCICTTGQTQSCYSGPPGTLGVGVCAAGTQTCTAGVWGSCLSQVLPGTENCAAAPDEDCDGLSPSCSGATLWAQKFGGSSSDPAYGIATDAQGNTYITGYFQGSVNFGAGTLVSAGSYDIFLLKLNASGSLLWSKRIGGTAQDIGYDVATDSQGNVVVSGVFRGTVNFGGANLVALGTTSYYDAFLAKYDGNGNHLWSKRFGGTTHDYGYAVEVDSQDNVILGGYFQSTSVNFGGATFASAGSYDPFVAKFDANGNHLWSNKWGSTSADYGYDIAVSPQNEIYLTGGFQGSVNFGGGTVASAGGVDAYLLKLSSSGAFMWVKKFGDNDTQYAYDIACSKQGDLLLAGIFQSKIDFGGGNLSTSTTYYNAYAARFDSNGNYVWGKQFGATGTHDYAWGAAFDLAGNAIVTGYFQGSVDFGGGTLTSAGSYDAFLLKLNAAGAHVYSKRFGNSSAQYGRRVTVGPSGNTHWVGYFQGTIDFGVGAMTSAGSNDIFLAKLAP